MTRKKDNGTVTFYKLRFKPNGKFYKPATGYRKTNISKQGKVYSKKSINFGYVTTIYVSIDADTCGRENISRNTYQKIIRTTPEDWEWVEYNVVQGEISPIKKSE